MLGRAKSAERNSPPVRAGERLAERRRNRRRRAVVALGILVLILFGACIWGLQQNAVRISHVEISETDTTLSEYATSAMRALDMNAPFP